MQAHMKLQSENFVKIISFHTKRFLMLQKKMKCEFTLILNWEHLYEDMHYLSTC